MIERHDTAIMNTVKYLDGIIGFMPKGWSYGTISIICALDYADFRAGHIDWRALAPKLANWYEGFRALPEWAETNEY